MAWFNLFENSRESKLQALADKTWDNRCLWEWTNPTTTEPDWVAAGGFVASQPSRFEHMSANGYFERDALVQRWFARIATSAVKNMRDEPALFERWAHVNNKAFWQELARVLECQLENGPERDACWEAMLSDSGLVGNVIAFECAPKDVLSTFVAENRLVHPHVGLWLVREGFCTMEHLRAQVNAQTFDLASRTFARCLVGEPMAPEYVAQWCLGFLRDYGLDTEQKLRVVGQAMGAFGQEAWSRHIEPVCVACISELDMGLVLALCGRQVVGGFSGAERELNRAVMLASQNPQTKYQPELASERMAFDPELHPGMRMLMSITTPQNRVELYFLASMARQADKGLVAGMDTLELPQLG